MGNYFKYLARRWAGVRWRTLRFIRDTITIPTRQGILTVSTRDDVIGKILYVHREYQNDVVLRATAFLREQGWLPPRGQGVVLDIGCNIGLISIGLLVDGQFQSAIGIEPDPTNFALCKRNIEQNGLIGRYYPIPMAVSDQDGELKMGLSRDNFGDHRVQPRSQGPGQATADLESSRPTISVKSVRLDSILATMPSETTNAIALAWIDVQGHEGFAFRGGSTLFSRHIPVVSEIWPFGLNRSGMGVPAFCELARTYWTHFWVWRRCQRYVSYSIDALPKFCEELGDADEFDDVIFTHENMVHYQAIPHQVTGS